MKRWKNILAEILNPRKIMHEIMDTDGFLICKDAVNILKRGIEPESGFAFA